MKSNPPKSGRAKVDRQFVELWQPKMRLVQSNVVSKSSFNYTLVQMKMFVMLIDALQGSIKQQLDQPDLPCTQLSLFANNPSSIQLNIPLSKFNLSPDRYKDLKMAAQIMTAISVTLPEYRNSDGKLVSSFAALISKVEHEEYSRHLQLTLLPEVAEYLVTVDRKSGFTQYFKSVALLLNSPYAIKLYMYLSSWKDKGGVNLSMRDFRKLLSIEKKYTNFRDIKRRILEPCKEQLKECGDIFFEYDLKYLDTERPNDPSSIVFFIKKRATTEAEKTRLKGQLEGIEGWLYNSFGFSQTNAHAIASYVNSDNVGLVHQKITELEKLGWDMKFQNSLTNPEAYYFKAIQNIVAPGNPDLQYIQPRKVRTKRSV